MLQLLRKFVFLEKWNYFRYSYRRHWIEVTKQLCYFFLFGFAFSLIFTFVETASLEGDNFLEKFGNTVYYFFTSISTIGYGDITPKTPLGKVLFVACLSIYGVSKVVQIIELVVQAKQYKLKLKEKGRLFMPIENHVIAFFDVQSLCKYNFIFLERFIHENLNSNKFANCPLLLINSCSDPHLNEAFYLFLQEQHYNANQVQLINADIYEPNLFDKISLNDAKHIYIFSHDEIGLASDSKVIDTIIRIRKHGYTSKHISAELIEDSIRYILKDKNVHTIIRPTRSYPEFFVRATVSEGSEKMLEELLSSEKDSIATFTVKKSSFVWGDLLYALSMAGIGTAMAYIKEDGSVDSNPKGKDIVENVHKILIMIHDLEKKDYTQLESEINNILDMLK